MTWPGRKQVYRRFDRDGYIDRDALTVGEDRQEGEPLLRPVLRGGKRKEGPVALQTSRQYAARQLRSLPPRLRTLDQATEAFKINVFGSLQSLANAVDE